MHRIPKTETIVTDMNKRAGYEFQKERRYFAIDPELIEEDSFLKAVIHGTPIEENPQISDWLLTEIKSLVTISERLDREMAFDIVAGEDAKAYVSEQITLGEQKQIPGRLLIPILDIPEGYRQIVDVHTHALNGSDGLAAFSNGFMGDWNNIMIRGDNVINAVGTSQGYIYILHRDEGSLQPIVDHFIISHKPELESESFETKYNAYQEYLLGENGLAETDEMTTYSGDDNNKRIEVNIRMAGLYGFDLYQIDMQSKKVQKLQRPIIDDYITV